jgi:hypothetical protein
MFEMTNETPERAAAISPGNTALKVAAMLALSIACVSCADGQAEPSQQNEAKSSPVAVSTTHQENSVDALRRRLTVASADAEQRFVEPLEGNIAGPIIARAQAEWQRRIDDCPDDACRTRLLADQLNRTEYSRARNQRPVAGLPWRTGALSISEPAVPFGTHEGSVLIWPIIDDRVLIASTSLVLPTGRFMYDMVAEGRILPGPIIRVRSLVENGESLVLRPLGPRRLKIDADRPSPGTFRYLPGDYEVELIGPEELQAD